jgi:hypothetical protein
VHSRYLRVLTREARMRMRAPRRVRGGVRIVLPRHTRNHDSHSSSRALSSILDAPRAGAVGKKEV